MEITEYNVRQDWREYDINVKKQSLKLWNQTQAVIICVTILVLVISLLQPNWFGWGVLRPITPPIIYLIYVFYITSKKKLSRNDITIFSRQVLLGLRYQVWGYNLLIGIISGGTLGLDFVLLAYLNYQSFAVPYTRYPIFDFGFFLFHIILRALGEEFLLRGIGYSSLYEGAEKSYIRTSTQIVVFNLIMYSVQIIRYIPDPLFIWIILFRLGYAYLAFYIRYQRQSIIPCIASNFVFNSLISFVLPW